MTEANAGKLLCSFPSWSLTQTPHMQRDTKKEGDKESEVFAKWSFMETFQRFCRSLWRFGKQPQQFNSSVVTMVERYPV